METWQRIWLYILIIFWSIHYLRDRFDELGIKNVINTTLVKQSTNKTLKILWTIFHTTTIGVIEIIFASICLITNHFGILGYSTIIIADVACVLWIISWIFF